MNIHGGNFDLVTKRGLLLIKDEMQTVYHPKTKELKNAFPAKDGGFSSGVD